LADCPDVHQLDGLVREVRVAGHDLCAMKIADKRDFAPQLTRVMERVESNQVFHDPRARFALEVLADLVVRLA
jgi:hypothetical protein